MTVMNLNKQSRLYSQDYRPWWWSENENEWQMIRLVLYLFNPMESVSIEAVPVLAATNAAISEMKKNSKFASVLSLPGRPRSSLPLQFHLVIPIHRLVLPLTPLTSSWRVLI